MKKVLLPIILTFLCFQIQAQTWTQGTPLPETAMGRNHAVSFSLNGFAYLGTGYHNEDTTRTFSDFYKYDPSNDKWTQIADFPGAGRGFSYGVSYGNKAYMGFGLGMTKDTSTGRTVSMAMNDLWEFDGETETWKELKKCPCNARYHPALVAAAGKIFVTVGGSPGGNLKDHWEYDIDTDTWTQKTDFPGLKRHHPYYFGIDSTVYVGFGHGQGIYKDFYAWSVNDETWTKVADLPAQGRVAGTQFSFEGKGYALSGQGEDHDNLDSGEFWQYDPKDDKWKELEAHPGIGRWAPATFILDGELYFGTGQTNIEHKDFWTFTLPTDIIVSVEHQSAKKDFVVYPNPSTGKFYFDGEHVALKAILYDRLGRQVADSQTDNHAVDFSDVPPGFYILQLESEEGAKRTPIVIRY
jgi:N-acetylneuraminic acid mutarotase